MSPFGTMRLGELIEALRKAPKESRVVFNFCGFRPGAFMSYRGYYEHLAIVPVSQGEKTVAQFLAGCEAQIGAKHEGYKGGIYTMDADTPVWVSEYGDNSHTTITEVLPDEWITILQTGYEP